MKWNAGFYDEQHQFVSSYGEDLIEVLQPRVGENILDLGCGTGDLSHQLSLMGCEITGMDASPEMIRVAKEKYPSGSFICADAASFQLDERFDAVFSNAVLHWIGPQDAMLGRVAAHLKPHGRFVAEFGAKGNVEKITGAIRQVLEDHGYLELAGLERWYFPSLGEYANRLERAGFEIRFMACFDRPTALTDEQNGIIAWLEMFGGFYFQSFGEPEKNQLLLEIQDLLRGDLYHGGRWIADYKRLRFYAIKK